MRPAKAAGLHGTVMAWLKQRDIVLLGGDGVNDVQVTDPPHYCSQGMSLAKA